MTTPREQHEKARAELVRSRGFIRGAETQLNKALDKLDAVEIEPTPDPIEDPTTPEIPSDAYELKPGESLSDALFRLEGRNTIVLPKGRHDLFNEIAAGDWKGRPDRAKGRIRLIGDPREDRDEIELYRSEWGFFRPYLAMDFDHLTIDYGNLSRLYMGNLNFRDVRWYSQRGVMDATPGKRHKPVFGSYTIRDSYIHDMLYGPTHASLVEDCHIERISGDALQGCQTVRRVHIDDMDGTLLGHHTDIFQLWHGTQDVLYEDVTATNIKATQGFYFESFSRLPDAGLEDFDPNYTHRGLTMRNVTLDIEPIKDKGSDNWGGPPVSQMNGFFGDCLFENVAMPNQRLIMRRHHGRGGFENVVFKGCNLHWSFDPSEWDGVEVIK